MDGAGIEYVNTISVQDYNTLRIAVGWPPIKEHRARIGLDHSAFVIVARCGDRAVGIARVVSDGGFVAYVADVAVHPEFQGRGIGRAMMERVVAYVNSQLEEDFVIFLSLHAAKGKEVFYNKFGFVTLPDETYGAGMSQWLGYENKEVNIIE